jgi:hypothetical protein
MKGNVYRNGLVLEMCVGKGQFKAIEHMTSAKPGTHQLARSRDSMFLHTHTHTHTHISWKMRLCIVLP